MSILLVLTLLLQPVAQPASEAEKALAEANELFTKTPGTDVAGNEKVLAAFDRAIALDPKKADAYIGRGRTLARIRNYADAFSAYGAALKLDPNNPMILRYRGHNYINVKRIDDALADLTKAEAAKKDDNGIYYHLALAHYLKGNYAEAAKAYEGCVRTAPATDEGPVACKAWQYLALRRAGRAEDAAKVLETVKPGLKLTEGAAYLDRLLLFKGAMTEQEVAKRMEEGPLQVSTVAYGIGIWHLLNNRPAEAKNYFTKATSTDAWNSFGAVASDVELKRMK
jgi:tetratricopeptide (TPR) repeat protein